MFHLLATLKESKENKCCKHGYLQHIHDENDIEENITIVQGGLLRPENQDCSTEFIVEFSADVCRPIAGTLIIVQIDKIERVLVFATNGCIKVVFQNNDISDMFYTNNEKIIYKNNHS